MENEMNMDECYDVGGYAKTVSGDIECDNISGNATTVSGDINASGRIRC